MGNDTSINPFVVGKYIDEAHFCDRDKETETLLKHIVNGRNVALISPRRLGKTGLISHLFRQREIRERYHTFLIDIYATSSLAEFVYLFGKNIFDELKPRRKQYLEQFFGVVKSLRVGFRLDAHTGEPVFELGIGAIEAPQTTLDEIFDYLEKADKPCVVAIDEFQQIGTYPEDNMEAMLRTKIQHCARTNFIFAGSKRHLMANMFNSPNKPFYQSVITMGLDPIPLETYAAFATRMFQTGGREVDGGVVERVYRMFDGVTWFVQMMMNELYSLTAPGGRCTEEAIEVAERNVIRSQEIGYAELLANLPQKQKMVLLAIAKEGVAGAITSTPFIRKYNLPSASSVQSAVRPLLKNDLVTCEDRKYRVYDYFLAQWLRQY